MAILGGQIRDDDQFKRDLRGSYGTVLQVAEFYRKSGKMVTLLPNTERPDGTYDERMKYRDDGDLIIGFPVEVKQTRRNSFTGLSDFPFSHVQVMSKYAWDQLREKPIFTVLVDRDSKCGAVIPSSTFDKWRSVSVANLDNRQNLVYQCPKELCSFITLRNPNDQENKSI